MKMFRNFCNFYEKCQNVLDSHFPELSQGILQSSSETDFRKARKFRKLKHLERLEDLEPLNRGPILNRPSI